MEPPQTSACGHRCGRSRWLLRAQLAFRPACLRGVRGRRLAQLPSALRCDGRDLFPGRCWLCGMFPHSCQTANASGNTLLCKYCRLLRAYPWENFPAEEHRAHGNPLAFIEHLLRAKHGSKEPRPKGKRARDSSCPHQTLIFNVALNFLRRRHIAFWKDLH